MHPSVDLQFVAIEQDCPPSDLIILPGSKNVLGDLKQLIDKGWRKHIHKHLRYGGKVIGICGGYQMLGHTLHDPDAIESNLSHADGFALLNTKTTLHPEKQLKKASANIINDKLSKASVQGYEIHCGVTLPLPSTQDLSLIHI